MRSELSFEEFYMLTPRQTRYWHVRDRQRRNLGVIRYYSKEKKYCFFPEVTGTGINVSMLLDVASFIELEAKKYDLRYLPVEPRKAT